MSPKLAKIGQNSGFSEFLEIWVQLYRPLWMIQNIKHNIMRLNEVNNISNLNLELFKGYIGAQIEEKWSEIGQNWGFSEKVHH